MKEASRARSIYGRAAALAMVLVGVACTKQFTGSGNLVSRQIPVTSFSKVHVSNAFIVNLSIGNAREVTVRVDDNLVDDLDVGVSGDTLRIGLMGGISVTRATLQADVTAPSVSAIEASGASTIDPSDRLTSISFALALSGASSFDGDIAVTHGSVELSGASRAVLSGSATTMSVTGSGASQLLATELSIGSLGINLSGASRADVREKEPSRRAPPACRALRTQGRPRSPRGTYRAGRRSSSHDPVVPVASPRRCK